MLAKAVPNRLANDGSIVLSAKDRAALDLKVVAAPDGELPDAAVRFGKALARPGEEALVVSPIAGRIPSPPQVTLGQAVEVNAPVIQVVPVLGAAERLSLGVSNAEIEGQIETAERELTTAEAAAGRARELNRSKIVSDAKLEEAETAVATKRAQLDALRRARGVQAQAEGTPRTLKAPASGTVVSLEATVGAVVNTGDVLLRILRPGPRWVDIAVEPSDPAGERYEVQVGQTWVPARLVAQGAVVTPDGFRLDRIEVADSKDAPKPMPGASVAVRVARGVRRGVVLPESAVVPSAAGDTMYVESTPGHFISRDIRVGARFGGQALVLSGVKAGEQVVTQGAMALRGEALRAIVAPPD